MADWVQVYKHARHDILPVDQVSYRPRNGSIAIGARLRAALEAEGWGDVGYITIMAADGRLLIKPAEGDEEMGMFKLSPVDDYAWSFAASGALHYLGISVPRSADTVRLDVTITPDGLVIDCAPLAQFEGED